VRAASSQPVNVIGRRLPGLDVKLLLREHIAGLENWRQRRHLTADVVL